jgi:hypothetical protein
VKPAAGELALRQAKPADVGQIFLHRFHRQPVCGSFTCRGAFSSTWPWCCPEDMLSVCCFRYSQVGRVSALFWRGAGHRSGQGLPATVTSAWQLLDARRRPWWLTIAITDAAVS